MMDVVQMHKAPKCVFLVWRARRIYLYTKSAIKSVFGYLVWVYLKCTVPKNKRFAWWHAECT